ncbi:GNAT family N-acetyltransferase [Sphingomonas qilianensis]|uniref:GNAT family N-acetyltransferase n=1 Tax=Sphingomonas qilianensis TaxID=1736690 RepID=A0ABU9XN26_9SPHN
MRIVRDDLTDPQVIALLDLHVRAALDNSPPGAAFVLDLSGLRDPAVTLWSAWDGVALLGLVALKELDAGQGEVKSMRTAPGHVRKGVAAAMLTHLIAEARARGYRRLNLETGTGDAFAPARALYERTGFAPCGPFGDYALTEFNKCYAMEL